LLELDGNAILIVSASDGIVLEAGMECAEMLGYAENGLIGVAVSDFMIDYSKAGLDHGVEEISNVEWHQVLETTWKHREGFEIPVRVRMKKIGGPGDPLLIVIARDIRELKAKDTALIASDARYYDLVENSGEGLGIVDTDEYFTFANPAACEIFGLPADEMVGKNLNSFLNSKSIEEIKLQTAIRKEGQKSIYELEIIRPDGERRWIIVTATPQYNSDRKFISTLGIFRDITQRKLAETKVRESEQRLHEIVDLTNDWIWEIDPKWNYSFVSSRVFDILGYQPEDMIGRSPFDFLIPEDVEKVKMGIRGLVHEFKPLNAVVNRATHKDGHIVYLETSGTAVFNEQGTYLGYRGADRDITLRKLHERELIVAKEKAEESDRLKSTILANISHELRTPLSGILGFAEILKEELHKSEYEGMIDHIHVSGKRLMTTLNSIITLSQLEAGKIKVNKKIISIEPCILSVVESMSSLISEKQLYINTEQVHPLLIETDDQLFKQLIQQILDNAVKFTEQGGVAVETLETTENGKGWTIVKIKDTGIGIDPASYDLIFQEFRQVSEGLGRKYQGIGIGLSISKKIIDLLGGKIIIESETGRGSSFSIWLPSNFGEKSVTQISTQKEEVLLTEKVIPISGTLPIVLLVEDNLVNKELTILFLRNTCQVDYAPDAATAIEMVRSKQYHAILLDINLGNGMSGIEATREIREISGYEKTPIIAVTGYTMAEEMEELYAAGCTSHIAKPFNRQTLLTILQVAMQAVSPH
jgi:PAS domain S-box-containing protein